MTEAAIPIAKTGRSAPIAPDSPTIEEMTLPIIVIILVKAELTAVSIYQNFLSFRLYQRQLRGMKARNTLNKRSIIIATIKIIKAEQTDKI